MRLPIVDICKDEDSETKKETKQDKKVCDMNYSSGKMNDINYSKHQRVSNKEFLVHKRHTR